MSTIYIILLNTIINGTESLPYAVHVAKSWLQAIDLHAAISRCVWQKLKKDEKSIVQFNSKPILTDTQAFISLIDIGNLGHEESW